MPNSIDDIAQKLIDQMDDVDDLESSAHHYAETLKKLGEAKQLLEPAPAEPTGFRAFLSRHASDLIKVAGTLSVVTIITLVEAKGDVIYRSKASKHL